MNNWINTNATDNNTITFTTGTNDTADFTWLPDPMLEWLPEASERKKYFPSWHLVRSYQ